MIIKSWNGQLGFPFIFKKAIVRNQLKLIAQEKWKLSDTEQLIKEMDEFRSNITDIDYQTYAKNAMFCLHIETDEYPEETENGESGNLLNMKYI